MVVELQADVVSDSIDTRLIAPLFLPEEAPWSFTRLTPRVTFEGTEYVLAIPLMVAVPKQELRGPLGQLPNERYTILNAIDFLLGGV